MAPVARRRSLLGLVGLVALVGLLAGLAVVGRPARAATPRDPGPFRGLGTWVDVYDYAPRFQPAGAVPAVTADSVDDMARLGVKTLYLQAAQDDPRSEGDLVDRALVGGLLRRAHHHGLRVVAWYLPHLANVDGDLRRVRSLARFRAGGDRFDGIALDIEWTRDVPDPAARNAALVSLSRKARAAAGAPPLGAIVLEPVLTEDVNRAYWPQFPWRRLRRDYDVWLPMAYWTNRNQSSGWRDGFRYTEENVRRGRRDLGDSKAAGHPIGGIGAQATAGDYLGFVRAARRQHAIGWSVYDLVTTSSSAWPTLRGDRVSRT